MKAGPPQSIRTMSAPSAAASPSIGCGLARIRPRLEWMEDRTLLSAFTVSNTNDSGPGSLREAILDSDTANSAANTISFAILGEGVQTIAPLSPLPPITNPVLIDGFSQPRYTGTPLIELSGQSAGTSDGLLITGPDVTVRGLAINNFDSGAGIHITGAGTSADWVYGNFLGTDPTGVQAMPDDFGVEIDSGAVDSTIGGGTAGTGNLISGNASDGVYVTGTSGIVIEGNLIGTDSAGTAPVGNGAAGVQIGFGATGNTVGGLVTADRNVIAGNADRGVYLDRGADSNVVAGNYIGVDATGLLPMGNGLDDAVSIDLSANNTIGGTVTGAGNVLDGAGDSGVFIYGDYQLGNDSSGTLIAGNIIGLAADGTTSAPGFGDQNSGVTVDSAPDTTIGGTVAAARNIISNNALAGVLITNFEEPDGAYGTVVQGNFIGTDVTGTLARGNLIGVDIQGASSSLIGTDGQDGAAGAFEGNVIAGNTTAGVVINGASAQIDGNGTYSGAANNVVGANLIGTTADGASALANGTGVEIDGGASNNTIGGATAASGNLIADNLGPGVVVGDNVNDDAVGNQITANRVFSNDERLSLQFDGSSDVSLPDDLISGIEQYETIEAAFQTTSGGVILGYQSSAASSIVQPAGWVFALYVGTDGKL